MSPSPQDQGFDYSTLDDNTRIVVQEHTLQIQACMARSVDDMVAIGDRLNAVKQQLRHGKFQDWLKDELGLNTRQANRFMLVAKQFKKDTMSLLNFAPTALYLLAEAQTPEQARNEAVLRAECGETITVKVAKEIVTRCKGEAAQISNQTDSPSHQTALINPVNSPDPNSTSCDSENSLQPEHAIVEVEAEVVPDDTSTDSSIPEPIHPRPTYNMGDRVRILRRQQGQDKWAGNTAKIWEVTTDGFLRVDVEGHQGVRFTLQPDWVEPIMEPDMAEPINFRFSPWYQEVLHQGIQLIVFRLLDRRIGSVCPDQKTQIQALSLTQIEDLGEALLDFSNPSDLVNWLETQH